MKKFKNEFIQSIRYIIPICLVFIGILITKNFTEISNFIISNISTFNNLLSPFFIGFIIAYILNQPIKKLESKFKLKRGFSVLIVYGVTLCIFIFAWLFIVPVLNSNINDILASMPNTIDQVQNLINSITSEMKFTLNNADATQQINDFITKVLIPASTFTASAVSNFIINFLSTVVSYTVNIGLGLVVSVYLLLSKETYLNVINLLSQKLLKNYHYKIKEFINILDNNIGIYIVAKAMDSTIYGIICTIILAICGSEYALLIGLIAGFTNMIPFFGPIIGTIVAVVINLFFSFKKAVIVLIVMIVVQQLESTILEPHFVGKQVGVPPILTMFAVTFAGKYTGFLGILLAVPVTGVILIYIKRFIYSENNVLKEAIKEAN